MGCWTLIHMPKPRALPILEAVELNAAARILLKGRKQSAGRGLEMFAHRKSPLMTPQRPLQQIIEESAKTHL